MSFAQLPVAGEGVSSIWTRRMVAKTGGVADDDEVERNVLSLLLDVPSAVVGSSGVGCRLRGVWGGETDASGGMELDQGSGWGFVARSNCVRVVQRSRSLDGGDEGYRLEMHTAQTAVKAALDVLEEPRGGCGLRIATEADGVSLVSPVESCFDGSGAESEVVKKKGRARMSQEKRKRLARRREREALVVSTLMQPELEPLVQHYSHDSHDCYDAHAHTMSRSAPVTPLRSRFNINNNNINNNNNNFAAALGGVPFAGAGAFEAFGTPLLSPRSTLGFELSSPALTTMSGSSGFGSVGTPFASPTCFQDVGEYPVSSNPPTLVVQPPSPQRVRLARSNAKASTQWSVFSMPNSSASVF